MQKNKLKYVASSYLAVLAMTSSYAHSQGNQNYSISNRPEGNQSGYSQLSLGQNIGQNFQNLFGNHGQLFFQILSDSANNASEVVLELDKKALLKNDHTITKLLVLVSDEKNEKKAQNFESLFEKHITIGSDYIKAVKDNDAKATEKADNKAKENAQDLAKFFSELYPSVALQKWQDIFAAHVKMEGDLIQAVFKGDVNKANYVKNQFIEQNQLMGKIIASAAQDQLPKH